jgi:hypothetical protein
LIASQQWVKPAAPASCSLARGMAFSRGLVGVEN